MMSDLPFEDRTDFENAERGRIDALDPCVVRAADGPGGVGSDGIFIPGR
jgi:alkyl sulfatase BDS1-like metallo-beta-lactamase superfamily hydrolase